MYRVYEYFPGEPAASQVIAHHVFADKVSFPPQLANSSAKALVAATAETIFIIKKNGAQIATMTFAIAGTVPVFADMAAAVTFAPDDYLTVEGPAIPDATLSDISVTLFGERYL